MDTAGSLLTQAHALLFALARTVPNPENRPGFSGFWQDGILHLSNLDTSCYAERAQLHTEQDSAHHKMAAEGLQTQAARSLEPLARLLCAHPATEGLFSDKEGSRGLGLSFDRGNPHRVGVVVGAWRAQSLRGSYSTLDRFPTTLEQAALALDAGLRTHGHHRTHILLDAGRAWETEPVRAAPSTLQALRVLVAGDGAAQLWCLVDQADT